MVGRLRVAKVCPSPLKILLALRAARFAAYCEIRAKLAIRSEGRADKCNRGCTEACTVSQAAAECCSHDDDVCPDSCGCMRAMQL